jgi:hypothetical protein
MLHDLRGTFIRPPAQRSAEIIGDLAGSATSFGRAPFRVRQIRKGFGRRGSPSCDDADVVGFLFLAEMVHTESAPISKP